MSASPCIAEPGLFPAVLLLAAPVTSKIKEEEHLMHGENCALAELASIGRWDSKSKLLSACRSGRDAGIGQGRAAADSAEHAAVHAGEGCRRISQVAAQHHTCHAEHLGHPLARPPFDPNAAGHLQSPGCRTFCSCWLAGQPLPL